MNHDQTNDAVRRSLMGDDSRETGNNVYPIARMRRQEAEARALLYPPSRVCARVEKVIPIRPELPPAA